MREADLGRRSVAELTALLAQHGRPGVRPIQLERQPIGPQLHSSADHEAECALLEAIERVTGGADKGSARPRSLSVLGAFVHGLRLGDYMIPTWRVLARRIQLEAVDAVVAAAVDALDLDRMELARDAVDALRRIRTDPNTWLLSIVPAGSAVPDWHRAAESPCDPQTLVAALQHPSLIVAAPAAQLLSVGAGGEEAARQARTVLEDDSEQSLRLVSLLAPRLWGSRALDLILERLSRTLSPGCASLVRALPDLPGARSDQRTLQTLQRALTAADARVARAAADALAQFSSDDLRRLSPLLSDVLAYWTDRGVPCDDCGRLVRGSCPEHDIEPKTPRDVLIRLEVAAGTVNVEQLLALCGDEHSGVGEAARQGLTSVLANNPHQTSHVLSAITSGSCSPRALLGVLALPSARRKQVSTAPPVVVAGGRGTERDARRHCRCDVAATGRRARRRAE